jgi:hypothetical protein
VDTLYSISFLTLIILKQSSTWLLFVSGEIKEQKSSKAKQNSKAAGHIIGYRRKQST